MGRPRGKGPCSLVLGANGLFRGLSAAETHELMCFGYGLALRQQHQRLDKLVWCHVGRAVLLLAPISDACISCMLCRERKRPPRGSGSEWTSARSGSSRLGREQATARYVGADSPVLDSEPVTDTGWKCWSPLQPSISAPVWNWFPKAFTMMHLGSLLTIDVAIYRGVSIVML